MILVDWSLLPWYEGVIVAAGVVLGAAGLIKAVRDIRQHGWTPFKERWVTPRKTRQRRIDALIDAVEGIRSTVDRVDQELRTNGGTSVKDMICGIETKVENIHARVKHQCETSALPIFELDEAANMRFANCAFRELVNADEIELYHRNYVARMPAEDRTRFLAEIRQAIDNKMPLDSVVRFRTGDTKLVSVRLQASPDVRPGGELKGFFGAASMVKNSEKSF